jgi:hypothetical protein
VFSLINVLKKTILITLLKPIKLTLMLVKARAMAYSDLNAIKQLYYKILLNEHKKNIREFEQ